MGYESFIRNIPDFPTPGILFRDITPLLGEPKAFQWALESLVKPYRGGGVDAVVAVEARGYVFGAPLAHMLNVSFVPVRKVGKLPFDTYQAHYDLEYGTATIEIHRDGLRKGQRVLIVDDVLATGGTLRATADLVEGLGAVVAGIAVLMELTALNGRARLKGYPLHAVLEG